MADHYVFICDAGPEVGFGHFSRCFNIACGLLALRPDADIVFMGGLSEAAIGRLQAIGATADTTGAELPLANCTVVLDRYDIKQDDIDRLAAASGALVKVDDFNEFDLARATAVVNFRAGAEQWHYRARHAFLGLEYYPAHPDFAAVRGRRLAATAPMAADAMKVLVSIGGTDRHGVARRIVEALDRILTKAHITWITTQPGIEPATLQNNELVIAQFSEKVAELYAGADAVISGGGVTKYEAGFCMVPNACISQTPEQQQDTEIMAALQLTYDIGSGARVAENNSELESRLEAFLAPSQLEQQRRALAVRYDVSSLPRLARGILDLS
jgi:spore coat polysaccharide biosynthesis predicted glycosyltransferase SpsG